MSWRVGQTSRQKGGRARRAGDAESISTGERGRTEKRAGDRLRPMPGGTPHPKEVDLRNQTGTQFPSSRVKSEVPTAELHPWATVCLRQMSEGIKDEVRTEEGGLEEQAGDKGFQRASWSGYQALRAAGFPI